MTFNPKTNRLTANIVKRLAMNALLFTLPLMAVAKDEFTALEQQKINIETEGLFSRSDVFNIDFAVLRPTDYSFPFPVGKARQGRDYAIEIDTKKGDAVKAMFDGVVRLSRVHSQFGNVIVVRHDNGLETMYARNAQNLVKVGDHVKAGQTIAIVGTEGLRSYCEFAVMVNGSRVNPEIILGLKSLRLHRKTIQCRKTTGSSVEVVTLTAPKPATLNKELANKGKAPENPFAKGNKFTVDLADMDNNEWCYPLQGAKVISHYGRRGGRNHTGVDLKTKPNDNILAAFSGEVVFSGRYSAYGNYIRIRHYNGLETCYSHNSKNLVKVGDRVKAGQVIALTGRTGRATTEHLHFEVKVNGQHINPANVFDHANHSVKLEAVTFTRKGNAISVSSDKKYMAKGKK